jgi:hypothetical protein
MSPTKQKPLNDILINTLVIAEATVSTLGFEDGSDSKKVWLIKLSQLEVFLFFFLSSLSLTLTLTLTHSSIGYFLALIFVLFLHFSFRRKSNS